MFLISIAILFLNMQHYKLCSKCLKPNIWFSSTTKPIPPPDFYIYANDAIIAPFMHAGDFRLTLNFSLFLCPHPTSGAGGTAFSFSPICHSPLQINFYHPNLGTSICYWIGFVVSSLTHLSHLLSNPFIHLPLRQVPSISSLFPHL